MYKLAEENSALIAGLSPTVSVSLTAKNGNDSIDTTGTGVSEDYFRIKNYEVSEGRFIQYADIASRLNVCVVGNYVAQELYGSRALGQEIKLNGNVFTIVGIMTEEDDSTEGSTDDVLFIPYSVAARLSGNATISSYSFSAADEDSAAELKTVLENYLYEVFSSDDYYRVMSMSEMLDTMTDVMGKLMLGLSAIAAISLLVGGIGIMNIMLVSVTERTREIGIRKSLGAKRKDIMRQFIIEAGTTSSIGGIVGIILGIFFAKIAASLMDFSASASIAAIAIAFFVSLSIGVIFGYLPASKAAKLNPIDALRYE